MRKFFIFILIVALCCCLFGCQEGDVISAQLLSYTTDIEPDLTNFDIEDEKYLENLLSFSTTIFNNQKEDKNILVSPLSLYIALGLLSNGVANDTLSQLEGAIGHSVKEINDYCYCLLDSFSKRTDSVMDINNSIWVNKEHPITVEDDFLQTNAIYYDMDVYRDYLTSAEGLKNINTWISQKTNGMIKNAVPELDPLTIFLLINTLYFESAWAHGKYSYSNYDFTDAKGDKSSQKFFSGKSNNYYSTDSAEAVRIYLDDGYYFLGILPKSDDIESYIESFDKEEFVSLLTPSIRDAEMLWRLPAFSYDYECNLVDLMIQMGVVDAFDSKACDLSNLGTMPEGNMYISDLFQNTRIELDNQGIKAAAVTVIVVENDSEPSITKQIYFDRPFVFAIMDSQTDAPLFMGSVKYL